MDFTLDFLKLFFLGLYLAAPLVLSLEGVIIILGLIVGRKESWTAFDALYWSFVTATTLGYGDLKPTRKSTKACAILIAFTGLIVSGIVVSIALYAATEAFKLQEDTGSIKTTIETITK